MWRVDSEIRLPKAIIYAAYQGMIVKTPPKRIPIIRYTMSNSVHITSFWFEINDVLRPGRLTTYVAVFLKV